MTFNEEASDGSVLAHHDHLQYLYALKLLHT